MKKILLLAALLTGGSIWAQMQGVFNVSTYLNWNDLTPYVETQLLLDAWTMQFEQQPAGGYQATAEITLVVRPAGDDEVVAHVKKYDLHSPLLATRDSLNFNILDVQRFALPVGLYDLELTMRDKGSDHPATTLQHRLAVVYDARKACMSDLTMLSSVKKTEAEGILSRGGLDLEPYVDDFVPEMISTLQYYCEIYNIAEEVGKQDFLAMDYIEDGATGLRIESSVRNHRLHPSKVVSHLGTIDISELPSGNYNLVVDIRNRDGQTMLVRRVPFQRSNPSVKVKSVSNYAATFVGQYTNEDDLNLYIEALYPLSNYGEELAARELIKTQGIEPKQAYLYQFWTSRYGVQAETEWLKYKERIEYVQANFSYPRTRGIVTDRGRVYLKYGPPSYVRDEKNFAIVGRGGTTVIQRDRTITDLGQNYEDQGNANQAFYLPYQLWRYDMLPNDGENRCFLFWDQQRSGYYTLLHSNARGEVAEADWEVRLSRGQVPAGTQGPVSVQFNRGY